MINKAFNILNQRILIIIFSFCILTVCFSIAAVYSNRIIFAETDKFEDTEIESVMSTYDNYNVVAYYPLTKNHKINEQIKSFMTSYIKQAENDAKYYMPKSKDEKLNLLIEYDFERINKDIVSFVFVIYYTDNNSINRYDIVSKCYNLKNGKSISLKNFFEKNSDYLTVLCEKSKEYFLNNKNLDSRVSGYFIDDISNSGAESFDGYSFSTDYLSIYFNSNKISSKYNQIIEVQIPWSDIKHLLKKNIYLLEGSREVAKEVFSGYSEESNLYFPAFNINVESNDKVIALTFDDGPHSIYTDKILKHLGKNNIVATFFVLGNRLNYSKELLTRMVDLGCEIGNHSLSHKQLTAVSDKEVVNQIESVNKAVKSITGYSIRAVRPPYGASDKRVKKIINKPIVLWNIDPEDWKYRDPEVIKNHVLSKVDSGSIILLHDIYKSSADAAIMIIDELLDQGYKFLTVSQMLELEDESTNGMVFTHKK